MLGQAAQNHVDDLVANGIYGHYGSDGSNVRTRVARTLSRKVVCPTPSIVRSTPLPEVPASTASARRSSGSTAYGAAAS